MQHLHVSESGKDKETDSWRKSGRVVGLWGCHFDVQRMSLHVDVCTHFRLLMQVISEYSINLIYPFLSLLT